MTGGNSVIRTANTFYWIIVLGTLLGIVVPALSIASKLKNVENLEEKLSSRIPNEIFLRRISGFIREAPSFHDRRVPMTGGKRYIRWIIYNIVALILAFLFKYKITYWIQCVLTFYGSTRIPIIIVFCLFTFQSKLFVGFWFSGIAGWDQSGVTPTRMEYRGESDLVVESKGLIRGINQEKYIKLIGRGNLKGIVILGIRNGKAYPINEGLSGFVFSGNVRDSNKDLWVEIINYGLREKQRSFSRLGAWRYPNHAVYNRLNLHAFPQEGFEKIEYWNVEISSDGQKVTIVNAKLSNVYKGS